MTGRIEQVDLRALRIRNCSTEELIEIPRCFSISIQSEVVLRWFAFARTAPAKVNRAAVKQQLLGQGRLTGVRMRDNRERAPARGFFL